MRTYLLVVSSVIWALIGSAWAAEFGVVDAGPVVAADVRHQLLPMPLNGSQSRGVPVLMSPMVSSSSTTSARAAIGLANVSPSTRACPRLSARF